MFCEKQENTAFFAEFFYRVRRVSKGIVVDRTTTPFSLNLWVQSLEFYSGIGSGNRPAKMCHPVKRRQHCWRATRQGITGSWKAMLRHYDR